MMYTVLFGLAALLFGLGWLLVVWAAHEAMKHERERREQERKAFEDECKIS